VTDSSISTKIETKAKIRLKATRIQVGARDDRDSSVRGRECVGMAHFSYLAEPFVLTASKAAHNGSAQYAPASLASRATEIGLIGLEIVYY
jgi:hypothetical protein